MPTLRLWDVRARSKKVIRIRFSMNVVNRESGLEISGEIQSELSESSRTRTNVAFSPFWILQYLRLNEGVLNHKGALNAERLERTTCCGRFDPVP